MPEEFPVPDHHPPTPHLGGELGREAFRVSEAECNEWLKRRGVDPEAIPRFEMDRPAFDLFRNFPDPYYAMEAYGIVGHSGANPWEDQQPAQYAWATVGAESAGPKLVLLTESDFGTVIDRAAIERDYQDVSPSSPDMPESSGGSLKTVDISDVLSYANADLETFAQRLMDGTTMDPFGGEHGRVGVRAGALGLNQQDAYVWTEAAFRRAVELTLAFPSMYGEVCVVSGQMRPPGNGKPGMAQIDHPKEVLRIEGEALKELQGIYRRLYHDPDFALTDAHRLDREELFSELLAQKISDAARANAAQGASTSPKVRYR